VSLIENVDECEVCQGQHGEPVAMMTFTPDDTGEPVPVRVCRDCLSAVFRVMVDRWNASIDEANESVRWLLRQLGLDPAAYGIASEVER
jgi:hypothetical protein